MNKDEIKKALECCSNQSVNYCKDCPYNKNGVFSCCNGEMFKDTLALITEQEQEIERLKAEIERLERVINDQNELCWGCKKSVKEFAEKLKKYLYNSYNSEDISYEEFCKANVIFGDIDKLLKEYEVEE